MNKLHEQITRKEKVWSWLEERDVRMSISIPDFKTDEEAELFIQILESLTKFPKE